MDTEEAVAGLFGCLIMFVIFAFWFLILWGLWEAIHWLARN